MISGEIAYFSYAKKRKKKAQKSQVEQGFNLGAANGFDRVKIGQVNKGCLWADIQPIFDPFLREELTSTRFPCGLTRPDPHNPISNPGQLI